jgi:hypothetical protein
MKYNHRGSKTFNLLKKILIEEDPVHERSETMKKEVSIVDVAKAANVSIATVSNVVNNKGRVSDKTKQKVQRVIAELGYRKILL